MNRRIWLIEPFYSGSHKQWADGYQKYSQNEVEIFSLPGRHWKWRMEGSAIHFAELLNKRSDLPHAILVTDMLDLAVFRSLLRPDLSRIPVAIYFHENQFAYPVSASNDREEFHYAWKNFTSALTADVVIFNSEYNRTSFFSGLRNLLDRLPDYSPKELVDQIEEKSLLIPVGLELPELRTKQAEAGGGPVLLWNHRWEHDKGPEEFFELLFQLKSQGFDFRLIVLGERYEKSPEIFNKAKEELQQEILHWGYAENRDEYWSWLQQADLLPVTSKHDFFGISVVEAIHAGVVPILPRALAYPELIDPSAYPDCYYNNFEELLARTGQLPWISEFKATMGRFSWRLVAPMLDESLNTASNSK